MTDEDLALLGERLFRMIRENMETELGHSFRGAAAKAAENFEEACRDARKVSP